MNPKESRVLARAAGERRSETRLPATPLHLLLLATIGVLLVAVAYLALRKPKVVIVTTQVWTRNKEEFWNVLICFILFVLVLCRARSRLYRPRLLKVSFQVEDVFEIFQILSIQDLRFFAPLQPE